jgi:hypothetical protein
MKHRLAFLVLDDIHHLHHILPIALELSSRVEFECDVYLQAKGLNLAGKMAVGFPQHRCRFEVVSGSLLTRIKCWLRQRTIASDRIIKHLSSSLLSYDVVVSPDMDIQYLIDKCRLLPKRPWFFLTLHGLGDRPMDAFAKYMPNFDLIFLGGNKYLKRLINEGAADEEKCRIVGYPKFDLISAKKPRLFSDDKPVVIYNPHFARAVSSWWVWGNDIIEYFYQQQKYNFIFAPHINLFNRRLKKRDFPKKYLNAKHIIVDFGSEKSVDMTYTQAADIYLGDSSSQVYEFIRTPRPCLFLNPQQIDWRNQPHGHFSSWQMGPVYENLNNLWKDFENGLEHFPYAGIQKRLFEDTFSITTETAGARAAQAIKDFLTVSVLGKK